MVIKRRITDGFPTAVIKIGPGWADVIIKYARTQKVADAKAIMEYLEYEYINFPSIGKKNLD